MAVRVTCINKDGGHHSDQHESISFFGWLDESDNKTGKCSRAEMVKFLEVDKGKAYVKDFNGNVAYCYVRENTNTGNKFVQTYSDGKFSDNLLSLMECR